MKVVICSDLHLGRSFAPFSKGGDLRAETLSREELAVPGKLAATVKEKGARALLIAGDLFDDHRFNDQIYEALRTCFESIPDTHVFIAPGSSDPYLPESPYRRAKWPENVHIFKNKLKAFEIAAESASDLPVRVYGIGCTGHGNTACQVYFQKLPAPDPAYLNVLLIHSAPVADGGIPDRHSLEKAGFDYYIFGKSHHNYMPETVGNSTFLFPGALIPHSFWDGNYPPSSGNSEAGNGLLAGELTRGSCDLSFERLFSRCLEERTIDVSAIYGALTPGPCREQDLTAAKESLRSMIRSAFTSAENVAVAVLTGTATPEVRAVMPEVEAELAHTYFSMKLIDRTDLVVPDYRLPDGSRKTVAEVTGEFDRLAADNTCPEDVLRMARNFALAALTGAALKEDDRHDDF